MLHIHHKLSIIVGMLLVPVVLFAGASIKDDIDQLDRIDTALSGMGAIDTAWAAVIGSAKDQPAAGQPLWGDAEPVEMEAEAAEALDAKWAEANDPSQSAAKRIAAAQNVVASLAQVSGLTLSPPDTAYALPDLSMKQLPHLTQRVYLVASVARRLSQKDELSGGDRMSLLVNAGQFKVLADMISRLTRSEYQSLPAESQEVIEPAAEAFRKGNASFQRAMAQTANSVNKLAAGSDLPIENLETQTAVFLDSIDGLTRATLSTMREELIKEQSSIQTMFFATSAFTAFIIIGASIAAFVMRRSIIRGIKALDSAIRDLAEQPIDAPLPGSENNDELGRIAQAVICFRDMTAKKSSDAALSKRKAAEELERAEMMRALEIAFGEVVDAAIDGDFTRRAPADFSDDELNQIADSLNRLLASVETALSATGAAVGRVAEGDLQQRLEGDFKGAFAELQRDVNATIERLSELIAQIAATTHDVTMNSSVIAEGSSALAFRAEQQAAALEQTTATMEEMSASVRFNADNSSDAATLAIGAATSAREGGQVVANAVTAMSAIEDSASEINDIVSVIDGIAFQTNLLALNAAIEAASAGEAGKGFAVVASEVRALAQRSADASRDVRKLVETSVAQVADGARLVSETGGALESISDAIASVEEAIKNIASTSTEQASGVQEISSAVAHLDQITQQNASLADQSSSNAQTLARGAARLQELISFFKVSPAASGPAEAPAGNQQPRAAAH